MLRHFSAGGVVMKSERGEPRVLLIKDGYGHWTWPKGHIEKGEKPEEAALREITEETGLGKVEILESIGKQEYYFRLKGALVFKTVYIFLVKANAREKLTVQTSEIEKAAWFRASDAVKKIEYKGSSAMLKKGIRSYRRYCG